MITKDMNIQELVAKYPETIPILQNLGLGCIGCIAARGESIEQGLAAHGLDINETIKKLNEAVQK